ncbi:protein of unknown function [Xenorhabdus poinarii G6]|uniref:Uncharacterized protein n=1 Tax=Xenorhabdus poinarii G6 TaxID=1354304 RepID=A0A068R337_9GAMM|nr:protein of unknown function [Xenorhabdus poinarii G6]
MTLILFIWHAINTYGADFICANVMTIMKIVFLIHSNFFLFRHI